VNAKPVVALQDVSGDVQLAYDYFEDRIPGAGERFLNRYFEAVDRIATNPWLHPVKFDDYHRALIPRSNLVSITFKSHGAL